MNILSTLIVPMIDNPLDGIHPNFDIFGIEFTQLWQVVVAAIWTAAIGVAIVMLLISFGGMAVATSGGNPEKYAIARTRAFGAAVALGLLTCFAIIVGAILALFG